MKSFKTLNKKLGETYELKAELNSDVPLVRKEAIKKVIASMTIGKDVGGLFPDVLKCIQTTDVELKKLVYLYLMMHATGHADLVVLAVNTFCKDCRDENELVRALAIRTMGCLRVPGLLDHLLDSLCQAIRDDSPYVRRAAVMCVAKVIDLSPEGVADAGFVKDIYDMILETEKNSTVVAAAVCALVDISDRTLSSPDQGHTETHFETKFLSNDGVTIDYKMTDRLLSVLGDCNEWGQIEILQTLSTPPFHRKRVDQSVDLHPGSQDEHYHSKDIEQLQIRERIIDTILPRLQHANPELVLCSIKVILANVIGYDELVQKVRAKVTSALLALMMTPYSELQYAALVSILHITTFETFREVVNFPPQAIRCFFLKFNDPSYVKAAKIDLMVHLVTSNNYESVLDEFADYARHEVDMIVNSKAILAISHVAQICPSSQEHGYLLLSELTNNCQSPQQLSNLMVALRHFLPSNHIQISSLLQATLPTEEFTMNIWLESIDDAGLGALFSMIGYLSLTLSDERGSSALMPESFSMAIKVSVSQFVAEKTLGSSESDVELLTCVLRMYVGEVFSTQYVKSTVLSAFMDSTSADLRDRACIYKRILDGFGDGTRSGAFLSKLVRSAFRAESSHLESTDPEGNGDKVPIPYQNVPLHHIGCVSSFVPRGGYWNQTRRNAYTTEPFASPSSSVGPTKAAPMPDLLSLSDEVESGPFRGGYFSPASTSGTVDLLGD